MPESTPRILPKPILSTADRVRRDLEGQARVWGAPLTPSQVLAHTPEIYPAVRGMWKALAASGLLETGLVALLNRRVAALNDCVF